MRLNMYYRLTTSHSNIPSTLSKDAKVKINRIIEEDEEESKKQAIKERIERLTEAIQRLEEELTYLETGISPESHIEKAG